ncbi:MAG: hypothetical protein IJ086_05570 [Clostridium sp.]|nr:hypothetical protein [Clostridium sp.]
MKTHRCEKSLEKEVSIRFCEKFPNWDVENDVECWRLYKYDLLEKYFSYITDINYCPFCGEKLDKDK